MTGVSSCPSQPEEKDPIGVLHEQLILASRDNDPDRLTELYTVAADHEESCGNIDAMCFFLTQAYVHALQGDHPACNALRSRLARHGRI